MKQVIKLLFQQDFNYFSPIDHLVLQVFSWNLSLVYGIFSFKRIKNNQTLLSIKEFLIDLLFYYLKEIFVNNFKLNFSILLTISQVNFYSYDLLLCLLKNLQNEETHLNSLLDHRFQLVLLVLEYHYHYIYFFGILVYIHLCWVRFFVYKNKSKMVFVCLCFKEYTVHL